MADHITPRKGTPTATNVTVGASEPILLVEAAGLIGPEASRKSVMFQNQGAVTVFIGGEAVATSGANRGYALFAGASFTDNSTATAWYGIAASSTAIVHVIEVT